MSKMPEEIWVVPSYTGTDTGTYDALGEGDYSATKYIRADLTSQKLPEVRDNDACFSESGDNALEALDCLYTIVVDPQAVYSNIDVIDRLTKTIRTALTQSLKT